MVLGIDIGTTSICAMGVDNGGEVVFSESRANASLPTQVEGEKIQDADGIVEKCLDLCARAAKESSLDCIGISTQMHGILYYDMHGRAVSPLYTWQDERGNLPFGTSTYAGYMTEKTGCKAAAGFGLTSVFYDCVNGKIPKEAVGIAAIGDYLAMRLCAAERAVMHETNAAACGLYDLARHRWETEKIAALGIPLALLPELTQKVTVVGYTGEDIPVLCAVGDNQASVYGALPDEDSVVLNVGTGSQISVVTGLACAPKGLELRPYFGGKYLVLGSPLCGGYAYQLLRSFFESVTGGPVPYETMNAWAVRADEKHLPVTVPAFRGTREEPALRASISMLDTENFNAPALTLSVIKGMCAELYELYQRIAEADGARRRLVGCGNGLRRNPVFQAVASEMFGMEMRIPPYREEAAYGAARLAREQMEKPYQRIPVGAKLSQKK